jgi:hypothetical protein
MSVLFVLFAFSLIATLLVFWYAFQVGREQRALEQDIYALQDRLRPSDSTGHISKTGVEASAGPDESGQSLDSAWDF